MVEQDSRFEHEETPETKGEYREGLLDVAGTRVYYLHAGSGRPMLLIHGLVGSSYNWRNNIAALAGRASVYAIDLVNMGKSERVGGIDAGLAPTARRVVAIMDALHLGAADLVAHSHGGAVALMLAALYPARVRRLILFAPANPYCRCGDPMVRIYGSAWGGWLAWTLPYLPSLIQRRALGQMYGGSDHVAESCLREVVDGLRRPGTLRHVLSIVRGWFQERAKLKAALRRIKRVPTLLIWGDQDQTVSLSSGTQLQRRLRSSELMVVPGGTHAIFEEMADEVNGMMLAWLARTALPVLQLRRVSKAKHEAAVKEKSCAAERISPAA